MPDLLLELFSEEIPARMQARGAEDLSRLVGEALAGLLPTGMRTYAGPRRIALAATVASGVAERRTSERGPRLSAPEQALAGFMRKHGATRDDLRQEGEFWVLGRIVPGTDAATLIAAAIPPLLRRFPWPKSMRWGGTSRFTWVRPLRRILCILDGEVVPFDLRDGEDDGHGLTSGNLTEGHRFMAPGAFLVTSEAQWRSALYERHVIVDAAERRQRVWDGVVAKATERGLTVVPDDGLLDEVAGLVEWPVPLLGRIDDAFMDLPPEVMQVSMRVNQRYFALRDAEGNAAPWFGFPANILADDGGAAIVAGNERVLRARFSDARHFWDLDRTRTLESRVEDLKAVTFHAKIGTQYDRVQRLRRMAREYASLVVANLDQAERAGLLCKADLTTGMVGEFPELQGIMGGYYADPRYTLRQGEDREVREAIRDHYSPRGPSDLVPRELVTVAVAMADKLDQLVQFFTVGEKPTGSGDPLALRRAALGLIRIVLDNQLHLDFRRLINLAGADEAVLSELFLFLEERLRVQLRLDNVRPDVVAAFQTSHNPVFTLVERHAREWAHELNRRGAAAIGTVDAWRRINNILTPGEVFSQPPDPALFVAPEEANLLNVASQMPSIVAQVNNFQYTFVFQSLYSTLQPIHEFFDNVSVNHPDPVLRLNRHRLLASVRDGLSRIADFSKIEG